MGARVKMIRKLAKAGSLDETTVKRVMCEAFRETFEPLETKHLRWAKEVLEQELRQRLKKDD